MIPLLILTVLAAPLSGCGEDDRTAAPDRAEAPATGSSPGSGAGSAPSSELASDCRPVPQATGLPELQGVADSGNSFWGLLFPRGEGPGLHAGQEEKIVWRMTGSGTFSIKATGPDGATIEPIWGPTEHGGSSWRRPGDEWGTGWNFPVAGCWTVRASRSGGATGVLTLTIS